MTKLELLSYAKVNLTLDVVDKRIEDGYHNIQTTMVPVSLADRVVIRPAQTIMVTTSPEIPSPPAENLAYRAAWALKERTGYPFGALITIDKIIPVAGGLAGGSTNAATVLKGLNTLWQTGLDDQALVDMAIRLGSDIPFFIPGLPALVEGIGERVSPVKVGAPLYMVLAVPDVAKSTGNVYRLFDELPRVQRPDTEAMLRALAAGDVFAVGAALGNVFEQVMLPRHPQIAVLREAMLKNGAIGALMSGAGPTVLGLVAGEAEAARLREAIKPLVPCTFVVKTVLPQEGQ